MAETLNTLRYAARAKRIRTKPIVVMDPREALILSLKREVGALQQENEHLRSTLRLQTGSQVDLVGDRRRTIEEAPKVDLERVKELDGAELTELVKSYMTENQALRQENNELYSTREMLLRDQEIVCRENERLLKKLEDVNSVCCRSPIIPARPTFSGELVQGVDQEANIWTNSESPTNGGSLSRDNLRPVSQTVSEEGGKNYEEGTAAPLRRHNSWDQNDHKK